MALTLEIVTPEGQCYSKQVNDVTLPTKAGEIDVLGGHQPLISILEAGEVKAVSKNCTEYLAVDKGFVRVQGDIISLVTEGAIDVKEIDLSMVEEAQRRAQEALKHAQEENADPAEIERLEAIARFSIAQQLVKKRHR